MTRIPWVDRAHVVTEFCTCTYVWHTTADGEPERRGMHSRDPLCPLHGDNAERSPF